MCLCVSGHETSSLMSGTVQLQLAKLHQLLTCVLSKMNSLILPSFEKTNSNDNDVIYKCSFVTNQRELPIVSDSLQMTL